MNIKKIITKALLALVQKLNPYKDKCLSQKIHRIADHYDPWPSGKWEKEKEK